MSYMLRPGVSFCEIEGSAIFLDLIADRYFCLGKQSSRAFLDYVCDPAVDVRPDWPAYGLVTQEVLQPTKVSARPSACVAEPVRGSLLESGAASVIDTVGVLWSRLIEEVGLKVVGLDARVRRVERLRRQFGTSRNHDVAARASNAFAASALWRSRKQRCLSVSIATVAWLAHRTCQADLIFGVRLHPFQAHCWAQCDGLLINDMVDDIRNFTPIRVI